jgi:hypothetical protein
MTVPGRKLRSWSELATRDFCETLVCETLEKTIVMHVKGFLYGQSDEPGSKELQYCYVAKIRVWLYENEIMNRMCMKF